MQIVIMGRKYLEGSPNIIDSNLLYSHYNPLNVGTNSDVISRKQAKSNNRYFKLPRKREDTRLPGPLFPRRTISYDFRNSMVIFFCYYFDFGNNLLESKIHPAY